MTNPRPCLSPSSLLPHRDYNQKHFVRNDGFHDAADEIQGPMRKIFIEFLERFCTAGAPPAAAAFCVFFFLCVPPSSAIAASL